jgi:hypothetical protein
MKYQKVRLGGKDGIQTHKPKIMAFLNILNLIITMNQI